MRPLIANADAIFPQEPLFTRLHVADEAIVEVVVAAIDFDTVIGIMPSASMILYTNRKRTGFPVLTKDFRLGISCGHTFSSSYWCCRFR